MKVYILISCLYFRMVHVTSNLLKTSFTQFFNRVPGPIFSSTNSSSMDHLLCIRNNSSLVLRKIGSSKSLILALHRGNNTLSVEQTIYEDLKGNSTEGEIIFGFFSFSYGAFLAIVSRSDEVPEIGEGVRCIKELEFVAIPSSTPGNDLPSLSKEDDAILRKLFSRHDFYYSTCHKNYDITKSFQLNLCQHNQIESKDYVPSQEEERILVHDDRFFWNRQLIEPLIEQGLMDWVSPITNLWTSTKSFRLNSQAFSLTLLSRRGRHRQGPR